MLRRGQRPGGRSSPLTRLVALGIGVVLIGALVAGVILYGNAAENQKRAAALHAVHEAYTATTGAESVKVKVKQEAPGSSASGAQAPSGQLKTGQAVLDYANDASSVTVQSPGQGSAQTLTIGTMVYQKVPAQQRTQIPGHKPWIKVDQEQLERAQYGPAAAKAPDEPPADPASMLVYLRGATHAKATGGQSGGSGTTEYAVRVSLDKAVKGTGPQTRAHAKQLEQQTGKHTLAMRIRLDDQNRVRNLQATVKSASGAAGAQAPSQPQQVMLSEHFYGYGTAERVHAPAPSKTADVTKQVLLQQRQQQMQQQMQQQQQQQRPNP
ncbi:MAG: hypothetical protein ACRDMV_07750 [Streptosporangiales bacterium]